MKKNPGAMPDRIFAVSWLIVCTIIIYQMWNLQVPFAYEPVGPRPFPLLLAGLMVICCGAMMARPDSDIRWPENLVPARSALMITVLLCYASLFETLGFPIATMLMVLVVSRLYGGSWMTGLISGLVIGILGYLFFDRLLQITLPTGLFAYG